MKLNHVLQNMNSARCLGPKFPKIQQTIPHSCPGTALYYAVERRYFEEKTSRADIASMFLITTNQLTKAVTGVDYESGPHPYKRKRMTDVTSTTPSKVAKTAAYTTPSTSHKDSPATSTEAIITKTVKGHQVTKALRKMTKVDQIIPKDTEETREDMLSSSLGSSNSEDLPEVNL